MIRIDYLKAFVLVIELGSFAKAARRLGLTEGGISHSIASVEEYFGARLLTRTVKGSQLTEEGKLAYEAAKTVLKTLEDTKTTIVEMREKPSGAIRIGASTIPGEYILPTLVSKFKERHRGIDFVVSISDSRAAWEWLINKETDLAAVGSLSLIPRGVDYEKVQIGKERLVLIAPRGHKISKRSSISPQEVAALPLILRERGSGTRYEAERILGMAGIDTSTLKTELELGSTGSVITAVAEGAGFSIISETAARKAEKAGLVSIVEIERVDVSREFHLVRMKGRRSKVSDLFWQFVESLPRK